MLPQLSGVSTEPTNLNATTYDSPKRTFLTILALICLYDEVRGGELVMMMVVVMMVFVGEEKFEDRNRTLAF